MPTPSTTLAVILGVSECPRAPRLQALPQCKNSADDFDDYLRASLDVPSANILNLFDSPLPASEQLEKIEEWLAASVSRQHMPPADLILYYSGHGGFSQNDQSYFLAVHRTRENAEGASSIRYVDLASAIKRQAGQLRKYLILDCCFAAASVMRMQSNLGQMVIQRVEDELPPSGTAVLCSSAAKMVSIAPRGERHTMFSGAILRCLKDGIGGGKKKLSLEDLGKQARRLIIEKYPNQAVRPELHIPEQTSGDCAEVPLFPNANWDPSLEKIESSPPASLHDATTSSSSRNELGLILGILSGAACAICTVTFKSPYGLTTGKELSYLAPLLPALIFVIALAVLNLASTLIAWRRFLLVASGSCAIWAAAWPSVVFLNLAFAGPSDGITRTAALFSSFTIINYISGVFFSLLILFFSRSPNGNLSPNMGRELYACSPLAALGLLPPLSNYLFDTDLFSLAPMLAGYVSWQAFLLNKIVHETERDKPSIIAKPFFIAPALFTMLFVGNLPPVAEAINSAAGPSEAPIAISVESSQPTDWGDKKLRKFSAKLRVVKTTQTIFDCKIIFSPPAKLVSPELVTISDSFSEVVIEFIVPASARDEATSRVSCFNKSKKYEFSLNFYLPEKS